MARHKKVEQETPGDRRKRLARNKAKRERKKERCRIDQAARQEHLYTPTGPSGKALRASEVEVFDPARPFALGRCSKCNAIEPNNECVNHESPIIVAIGIKGKSPAACSIFCNVNSRYNTTFMLHGDTLNRIETHLHAVLAALRQIHAFFTKSLRKSSQRPKSIKQIVIKCHSKFLINRFAGGEIPARYNKYRQQFDAAVEELGKGPAVKFWRPKGGSMAQQVAESMHKGWEEANLQEHVSA